MSFRMYLIAYLCPALIIPHTVTPIDSVQKTLSCGDIETPEGFNYPHNCTDAVEICVSHNKTTVAVYMKGKIHCEPEVKKMDNSSVITEECKDLQIDCTIPDGTNVGPNAQQKVRGFMLTYHVIEKPKISDSNPTSRWITVGVPILVICSILVITMLCLWKLKIIQFSCCGGGDVQDNNANNLRLNEIHSAPDQSGSGENEAEPDGALETVHVHNTEAVTDDETLALHLDRYSTDNENCVTKNGHTVASAENRDINRNQRDDPGGVHHDGLTVRETDDGSFHTDSPGNPEAEREPLLSDQRANIRGVTGEAASLVDNCSCDQDLDRRCLTPPDSDVKSTPAIENCKKH